MHCVVTEVLCVSAYIRLKAVHKEMKEIKMIRPTVSP